MNSENNWNFPYLPATAAEREAMLKDIGVRAFDDLVSHIPGDVRLKTLDMQEGLSEMELSSVLSDLAAKNKPASRQSSFLGGGSYRRFVPAVVPSIISRSEFSTAYTPYQPEVSQGSLQFMNFKPLSVLSPAWMWPTHLCMTGPLPALKRQ
jgi:glycine dehydrogenase subunit 1